MRTPTHLGASVWGEDRVQPAARLGCLYPPLHPSFPLSPASLALSLPQKGLGD